MIPKSNVRSYLVNLEDYQVIREIGRGAFGVVNLIEHKTSHQRFAAKVNFQSGSDPNQPKIATREIGILIRVHAPTIIRFSGFSLTDFSGDPNITYCMEYKENGSLQQLLNKEWQGLAPHEFDNTAKQIILCGIAHGMMILHSRRVIHRDLKPDNVLLDSEYRPCITDFGLSKFLDPENSKTQSKRSCGTTKYIAPEVFESNHYGQKCDVYSFGILMYEIVTGTQAYHEEQKQKDFTFFVLGVKVIDGFRPSFVGPIKNSFKKLIERCWAQEPKDRPSFRELFHKLSLSLDDDDETIESKLDDLVSEQSEKEDEYCDFYKYCLDDVDIDKITDYVDEITGVSSNKEESKTDFETIIRQNQQKIEELSQQYQDTRREIDELKKQHQKEINKVKKKNKKEIEDLMQKYLQMQSMINDLTQNKHEIDETINDLKLQNAKEIEELKRKNLQYQREIDELKKQFKTHTELAMTGLNNTNKAMTSVSPPLRSTLRTHPHLPQPELSRHSIVPHTMKPDGTIELKRTDIKVSVMNKDQVIKDKLKSIIIPAELNSIDDNAFSNCDTLECVTIMAAVSIGKNAFANCRSLTSVKLPISIQNIYEGAFAEYSSLQEIINLNSVEYIGAKAFYSCGLLSTITLSTSLKVIREYAFANCVSLKTIEIPSTNPRFRVYQEPRNKIVASSSIYYPCINFPKRTVF